MFESSTFFFFIPPSFFTYILLWKKNSLLGAMDLIAFWVYIQFQIYLRRQPLQYAADYAVIVWSIRQSNFKVNRFPPFYFQKLFNADY